MKEGNEDHEKMSVKNTSEILSTKNYSETVWPMIRTNSPWEDNDEECESPFNEALLYFAQQLQADKSINQAILDRYTPKTGPYSASRGKYMKNAQKPHDNNGIYAVRLNHNATSLVVGYENGLVEAIDLLKEVTIPVKQATGFRNAPSSIRFHPTIHDQFYFSTSGGFIYMCSGRNLDTEPFECSKIISEGCNETYAMDINITGDQMITGGKDSRIRVYDMETTDIATCYKGFSMECKDSYTRLLEEDEHEGHYLHIYCVVCHPDNPFVFASAGLDSNIKLWDLRVKQFPVKNIYGPHILGDAVDLQGDKVLSGQWAGSEGLQVWDAGSARLLQTLTPPNRCPESYGDYFYCAKFMKGLDQGLAPGCEGDLVLAGGAGLGGLLVVSIKENLILSNFKDDGTILSVDSKSEVMAYGGTSHVLHLSQFFPVFPDAILSEELCYQSDTPSMASHISHY